MTLKELVEQLDLEIVTGEDKLERAVDGGYCSDLLSFVMSRSNRGDVWITLQSHPNIVAVASLIGLSAIIVTEDVEVEEETRTKAERENTVILKTGMTSFEVSGQLHTILKQRAE